MEKEKSNPYTFFILRYRLVNLQGGIFAFEKEKNYGRRKNRKTKSTGQSTTDKLKTKVNWKTKFPLSPIRNLLLQEISGAGIYFCKLEPRIPIQQGEYHG